MFRCLSIFSLFIQSALFSAITINETPYFILEGDGTHITRPEGVCFSHSGDYLALSNSGYSKEHNSIVIYKRTPESATFDPSPVYIHENDHYLSYSHEVKFSPDDRTIAYVNRNRNQLMFFAFENGTLSKKPTQSISGKKSQLTYPAGLSYNSDGTYLAVANRAPIGSITIYQFNGNQFETIPVQALSREIMNEVGAAAPHDIAISPDDKILVGAHKKFYEDEPGESAITIFRNNHENLDFTIHQTILLGEVGTHTISFHPSGNIMAVSDSFGDVMVFERDLQNDTFQLIQSIPVDKEGLIEGPKAVAFSSQGDILAVTTLSAKILFFNVEDSPESNP